MPATSRPVWAAKPAVNTLRFAARLSPAATTALPAANNASGSTTSGATRGILAQTARRRYSPNGRAAKLATTTYNHNSLINSPANA